MLLGFGDMDKTVEEKGEAVGLLHKRGGKTSLSGMNEKCGK